MLSLIEELITYTDIKNQVSYFTHDANALKSMSVNLANRVRLGEFECRDDLNAAVERLALDYLSTGTAITTSAFFYVTPAEVQAAQTAYAIVTGQASAVPAPAAPATPAPTT